MKQFTHLKALNSLLRLMDNRLSNLLNTNEIRFYTEYCLLEAELVKLLTGKFVDKVGIVKPVYTGHLHVDKDLEYLLNSVRKEYEIKKYILLG